LKEDTFPFLKIERKEFFAIEIFSEKIEKCENDQTNQVFHFFGLDVKSRNFCNFIDAFEKDDSFLLRILAKGSELFSQFLKPKPWKIIFDKNFQF